MLLTLYNESMGTGNPNWSLPQTAGGSVYLAPGGAGVQNTNVTTVPWIQQPTAERVIREVLDVSQGGGLPTPAATGNLLIMATAQSGMADWQLPSIAAAPHLFGQYGIVWKPGSTQAIDENPVGSGVGAEVVIEGPCQALCTAPTAGGAIALGTLLVSDGQGNLQPIQPPAGAPTPTVTPTGGSATTWTYKLAALSVNGVWSALGTAASTTAGVASMTTAAYNTISWVPIADAAGYLVVRTVAGTSPNTTGAIAFVPAGVTQIVDNGLAVLPNTTATQPFATLAAGGTPTVVQITGATAGSATWTYTIAAIAPNGVWGAAGSGGSVTTGAATLTTVNANKLTWTATSGATGYAIQRSASGGTPSSTGFIGYANPGQATTGFIDYGIVATTYTQNTTPNVNPQPGVVIAKSLGTLASGTTTPTLVNVAVGIE